MAKNCNCGNPEQGFNCVCSFVSKNPGNKEFTCEHCGIYDAGKPACNKCKQTESSRQNTFSRK